MTRDPTAGLRRFARREARALAALLPHETVSGSR